MRAYIGAAFLTACGCLQMVGDLARQPTIKAIGAATQASPAPKVFTAQNGFETFSSQFYVDWRDRSGSWHTIELTPQVYGNLRGPYNRRNAYGAALSYAPVLISNPRTKPMFEDVTRYGFCGAAPLPSELGIPREQLVYPLRVRLEPRTSVNRNDTFQRAFWVTCG